MSGSSTIVVFVHVDSVKLDLAKSVGGEVDMLKDWTSSEYL